MRRVRFGEAMPTQIEIVECQDDTDIASLRNSPGVEYIEQDHSNFSLYEFEDEYHITPEDTLWVDQWGPRKIRADYAWYYYGHDASNIIVAVVDTGVDYEHDELRENMWVDPDAATLPPWRKNGCGFVEGYSDSCMDDHGHGSHVAGSIAAIANNSKGIAGICWNAQIMSCKIFGKNGEVYYTGIIEAIDYAISKGARVMNHSWGGHQYNAALAAAWSYAHTAGVLMCCAAGNEYWNNDLNFFIPPAYPATFDTASNCSIAASDIGDNKPEWSNFGFRTVHVGSPGVDILSIDAMAGDAAYVEWSGTSMATPHFTGSAALFWSLNPTATNVQVKNYLLYTSTTKAAWPSWVRTGGILDIQRALNYVNGPTPLGTEGLRDLAITEESISGSEDDPRERQNRISWTLPPDATHAVICVNDTYYPQEPTDDVVYSGTDLKWIDTPLENIDAPRYYSCWAFYGTDKHSLPDRRMADTFEGTYPNSYDDDLPFVCPLAPIGYDFICNSYDEPWLPVNALLDAHVPAQIWRALGSKYRTWEWGYEDPPQGRVHRYPVNHLYDSAPSSPLLFGDYNLQSESEPVGTDVLPYQHRTHVAAFYWDVYLQLGELQGSTELWSDKFGELMQWTWLDYWWYRSTGEIKTYKYPEEFERYYNGGDADLFWRYFATVAEYKEPPQSPEHFKYPTEWYYIITIAKNIIHNLRVLYTSQIPWYTRYIEGYGTTAQMEVLYPEQDEDGNEIRDEYNIYYFAQRYSHGDPPMRSGDEYAVEGLVDLLDPLHPAIIHTKESGKEPYWDHPDFEPSSRAVPSRLPAPHEILIAATISTPYIPYKSYWYWPTDPPAPIYIPRVFVRFPHEAWGDYSVTNESTAPQPWMAFDPGNKEWRWHGHFTAGNWVEKPLHMEEHSIGSTLVPRGGSCGCGDIPYEWHKWSYEEATKFPARRGVGCSSHELYLPEEYDWEAIPVLFKFRLKLWAFGGLGNEYKPLFEKVFTPQYNDTGSIVLQIYGDLTEINQTLYVNPSTVYAEPNHIQYIDLGEKEINTAGPHRLETYMRMDLALNSIPHAVGELATDEETFGTYKLSPDYLFELDKSNLSKWVMKYAFAGAGAEVPTRYWYMRQNARQLNAIIEISTELA